MYVYTYTRGCDSHSPAVSQNQLGGEWNLLYNNYHLITLIYSFFFYSFYVSLKCVIMQQHVLWKSRVCTRAYMHTLIYT